MQEAYVDVVDLIVVRVALGDGVGAGSAEGVVVGDVCVMCELNCSGRHARRKTYWWRDRG